MDLLLIPEDPRCCDLVFDNYWPQTSTGEHINDGLNLDFLEKTLLSQDVMYMKQMDEHFDIKNVIDQYKIMQVPRFAVINSSTLFWFLLWWVDHFFKPEMTVHDIWWLENG